MPGPFQANTANCVDGVGNGEISWNHNYFHLKNFSVAQDIAGNLNPQTQAAGRMFCHFVSPNGEVIVWTQNDGRMLGVVSGAPHADVFKWWGGVHHDIAMAGGMGEMPMPTSSPSMHMPTPSSTMSMTTPMPSSS